MVTARDAVMDKVAGLDAGADDYLTKPFAIEELFARIRVALKRSEAVRAASGVGGVGPGRGPVRASAPCDTPGWRLDPGFRLALPATLTVGSVVLDSDRREVTVGGSPIALTAREFDVLALLMAHAETVLTRERIAHEALGYEYVGDTNNVDVHIAHLRAKIEDAGGARIIKPCAGWAMSAVRNAEAKRVTSIARAINWSYMWRRLMSYVWLDLLLVVIAAAILVYGYNQTLPDGAFTAGWIPSATVRGMSLTPARGWDLTTLTYTVEFARTTKTFPSHRTSSRYGLSTLSLWVGRSSACSTCSAVPGACAAPWHRSTIWPCAWTKLGRMQLSGGKMETLEQAIVRASVDSPSVTTGDADLASIEVALNRLLRQMQEAKLQQMRFVNDASHELRTPIAVIQGYVNMLDRWGKDDPDVLAESIASLKAESEHMQELVEQLLFLARGDAGRTVLRRANTNLAALVGEVCEESQMIDTEHTYRLAFDAALVSDPRCDAPVDVALVKQALRVIVQNAAKYSDAGTTVTFGVTSDAGAGTIDISVEDEGIGMNQESAAHAFERFYRADNARDAGAQGSGLGLAIAKWIVDSHGGVIGVTSVEGVGSRFTIRLPR